MNDRIGVENFENKTAFNKFRRSLFVNAKRLRGYPAVKIGRLAVRKNDSRKGYGSIILDFIKMMLVSERTSACRFIVVDAYKDAIQFYEKNGFSILSAGESRSRTCLMYFDLMELCYLLKAAYIAKKRKKGKEKPEKFSIFTELFTLSISRYED